MLIKIAWRNVWRNKTRNMVIIIAVALGLWGGVFSDAFMQGMAAQQIYSSIHTETGHIQMNRPGYLLNHDMQLHMDNADSMVTAIKAIPGVAAASATMQLTAMVSAATGSVGVMVNGINVADQKQVSDIYKLVADGSYFQTSHSNPVVIGKQLADKLKAKIGSRIVLTLQTSAGDIIYGAFRVTGIFRTHNSDFDKQMIFVRNTDLLTLIAYPVGTASIITVLLNNTNDTKNLTAMLQSKFPALQVQTWMMLSPMLQVISGTMAEITYIFVGIILIALAFGIVNTMLMAVLDRTREIGMLLSIGMNPSKVFGMIMLETIFLSITGAACGIAAGFGTILYFGHHGINLSFISEGINALGYSSTVYPTLGASFYAVLAAMVIVISVIAGIFPARHAIMLRPAEAVRGD